MYVYIYSPLLRFCEVMRISDSVPITGIPSTARFRISMCLSKLQSCQHNFQKGSVNTLDSYPLCSQILLASILVSLNVAEMIDHCPSETHVFCALWNVCRSHPDLCRENPSLCLSVPFSLTLVTQKLWPQGSLRVHFGSISTGCRSWIRCESYLQGPHSSAKAAVATADCFSRRM